MCSSDLGALLGGEVYAKSLRIGALTLPLTLFVLFSYDVLRVTFQPWKFIALNLTWTLTVGGLTLYFVLVQHLGVAGALRSGRIFGGTTSCTAATVKTPVMR